MNGPEHYQAAEELLSGLDVYDYTDENSQRIIANQVAEAQVHATLALAAATALNIRKNGALLVDDEVSSWQQAVAS